MFHDWSEFYALTGTAAATLIGLLFVAATLTTGRDASGATLGARVFMSPVVFHFALVLVISALDLAPRVSPGWAGLILGLSALAGFAYALWVAVMLGRQGEPEPAHWSDIWWYGIGPMIVYGGLGVVAVAIGRGWLGAAYGAAVVLLTLLLVGIRNAWDLVTWLAPRRSGD